MWHMWGPNLQLRTQMTYTSAQNVELVALLLLRNEIKTPINILTDSLYLINLLLDLPTNQFKQINTKFWPLLEQLQKMLWQCNEPLFITYT